MEDLKILCHYRRCSRVKETISCLWKSTTQTKQKVWSRVVQVRNQTKQLQLCTPLAIGWL